MKFVIYHSSNVTEPRQSSNQTLVSSMKGIKREKMPILHSRMKGFLMALADVYT